MVGLLLTFDGRKYCFDVQGGAVTGVERFEQARVQRGQVFTEFGVPMLCVVTEVERFEQAR